MYILSGPSARFKATVFLSQEFSSLWPQLAVVFDGGSLDQPEGVRSGSTVVDLSKAGLFTIIRPGR